MRLSRTKWILLRRTKRYRLRDVGVYRSGNLYRCAKKAAFLAKVEQAFTQHISRIFGLDVTSIPLTFEPKCLSCTPEPHVDGLPESAPRIFTDIAAHKVCVSGKRFLQSSHRHLFESSRFTVAQLTTFPLPTLALYFCSPILAKDPSESSLCELVLSANQIAASSFKSPSQIE